MSEEQTCLTHEELNIWKAVDDGDGEQLLKLLVPRSTACPVVNRGTREEPNYVAYCD